MRKLSPEEEYVLNLYLSEGKTEQAALYLRATADYTILEARSYVKQASKVLKEEAKLMKAPNYESNRKGDAGPALFILALALIITLLVAMFVL